MWQERAKITSLQIIEIRNLYAQLDWKISDLEHDLGVPLAEMFWLQGNSIISGAKLFLPEDYENVEITL